MMNSESKKCAPSEGEGEGQGEGEGEGEGDTTRADQWPMTNGDGVSKVEHYGHLVPVCDDNIAWLV